MSEIIIDGSSEFTFRDLNGYQIAVGGGVINKELIA